MEWWRSICPLQLRCSGAPVCPMGKPLIRYESALPPKRSTQAHLRCMPPGVWICWLRQTPLSCPVWMTLERDGGQAQFIVHEPPTPDGATLEPLLRWMEEHMDRELRLEDLAAQAMMSTRTLSRRFREQTGTTPLQWLNRARLRKAQCL